MSQKVILMDQKLEKKLKELVSTVFEIKIDDINSEQFIAVPPGLIEDFVLRMSSPLLGNSSTK